MDFAYLAIAIGKIAARTASPLEINFIVLEADGAVS